MIANVAMVRTTALNGATELSPGSHRRDYKYWKFVCARHPKVQVNMNPGDVLLRPSTLWHRGMPNRSQEIRPMLGFTWEDGGSQLEDPFSLHGGKIRFLPNRYGQGMAAQARERAFATLPRLGGSYLFLRSLLR
jgi:ectoine hydroxylase-related dioxygenase (phytanoyl-CoA dioxygenase family)